jgi:hypothetical protein
MNYVMKTDAAALLKKKRTISNKTGENIMTKE